MKKANNQIKFRSRVMYTKLWREQYQLKTKQVKMLILITQIKKKENQRKL